MAALVIVDEGSSFLILQTIRFLRQHPLTRERWLTAVFRYARWQLCSRAMNVEFVVPFVGPSKLLLRRGMTGATGNLYAGLHDCEEMAFLLHFLRPADLFVDIGANIGSYTVLAAAVVGAQCVALEPVPAAFEMLSRNIDCNRVHDRVTALMMAAGHEAGSLEFTASCDTGNHALSSDESVEDAISVQVDTLDRILSGRVPRLMKIDVEGFEARVLAGGERTLADPGLQAVIMELNGSGARYGFDERQLENKLLAHGFVTCLYDPFKRQLNAEPAGFSRASCNVIYVRDVEHARERVRTADTFDIASVGRRL